MTEDKTHEQNLETTSEWCVVFGEGDVLVGGLVSLDKEALQLRALVLLVVVLVETCIDGSTAGKQSG